jgi:hypothetical protein
LSGDISSDEEPPGFIRSFNTFFNPPSPVLNIR